MSNYCKQCGKEIDDEQQVCLECQGFEDYECGKCGWSSDDNEKFVFYGDGSYECKDCYSQSLDWWKEKAEKYGYEL